MQKLFLRKYFILPKLLHASIKWLSAIKSSQLGVLLINRIYLNLLKKSHTLMKKY